MTDKLYGLIGGREREPGDPDVLIGQFFRNREAERYARLGRAYMALREWGHAESSIECEAYIAMAEPTSAYAVDMQEMADAVKALED